MTGKKADWRIIFSQARSTLLKTMKTLNIRCLPMWTKKSHAVIIRPSGYSNHICFGKEKFIPKMLQDMNDCTVTSHHSSRNIKRSGKPSMWTKRRRRAPTAEIDTTLETGNLCMRNLLKEAHSLFACSCTVTSVDITAEG